jgi:hypothetical protein
MKAEKPGKKRGFVLCLAAEENRTACEAIGNRRKPIETASL